MNEMIGEKFQPITTVTIKATVPYKVWEEWNKDCVENFNGTRYLKMRFDHEYRKQFSVITDMVIREVEELRDKVAFLESQLIEQERKPEVKKNLTFAERTIK